MKRFVFLFFIAIFALTVTANNENKTKITPGFTRSRHFDEPTISSPTINGPKHTSKPTRITHTFTSSAAPTSTETTGRNAQFNQTARDGKPSGQVCDIAKLPPTDGKQPQTPDLITCSNTQQGEIPDIHHMVSTVILTPKNGATILADTPFNISARTANLNLGFFDDPETQYYLFSQQLDKNGFIMGHQHVTIQEIIDPNQPMDPKQHIFFKGLNAASSNHGVLSVEVTDGVPVGNYRLCTLTGSFGHQPVIMPVAQRGAQDDCIRFDAVQPV